MNENMLANFKFVFCSGATAAGVTTIDGAVIDMAQDEGYDGITLVTILGDVLDTATNNLRLMGSATSDGAAPSVENETGVSTAGATDHDSKLMVLDTRCPANRFVFSRQIRAVANSVLAATIAILYKARKMPVVQGADVIKAAYDWVLGT